MPGQTYWDLTRDTEGHREYKVKFRVRTDTTEGPATALQCPGLPVPGSWWIVDDDVDLWAWCRANSGVKPAISDEPGNWWELDFTFATKPPDHKQQRCQDTPIEDPLLEPQKVSGAFTKYTEEASYDRFGMPIINSAFEQVRGPQAEFDKNRPSVKIEQNVANLGLEVFAPMVDTLNMLPQWGLPVRCIKLSNVSWELKFYGSCYVYYTRTFDFDVRFDTFDRNVLDEGTKVLRGSWQKDPTKAHYGKYVVDADVAAQPTPYLNPTNFIRFKDWHGENTRVILDGQGRPVDTSFTGTGTGDTGGPTPGNIFVQKYDESNFFILAIPTVLDGR
jgi:hypothetical protein